MKEKNLTDEQNPAYLFNLTHTDLLCAIVNGEIDPVQLAREQLANRGLDNSGKWVGFDKAAEIAEMPKFEQMQDSAHFWARIKNQNRLAVFVKEDNGAFIAGGWEGEYGQDEIEVISLIVEPKLKGGAK